MMWSLFIQLSINQVKDIIFKNIFKKFIKLFKSNNYAYYLCITLAMNILFFPYYFRAVLESFITIIDVVFILSCKIFFLLCLNYGLLHIFYIFQKELNTFPIPNSDSEKEDSEDEEEIEY